MIRVFLLLSYVVAGMANAGPGAATTVHLLNSGFEQSGNAGNIPGWEVRANGHVVSIAGENPASGTSSLRIQSGTAPRGTLVRQAIPLAAIHDGSLQLHGKLRTEDVSGSAVLFVVVDGDQGRLFADDMRNRQVHGTTGWTHYTIAIPELDAATSAYAGVLLLGAGTAWADDFRLVVRNTGKDISPEASTYLDNAMEIMASRYVNRENIDWNAMREFTYDAARGAKTPRDTWPAIAAAVTRLGDGHSRFMGPTGGVASPVPGNGSGNRSGNGPGNVHEVRIQHELLDGGIAYIDVPAIHAAADSSAATAYIDHMHAALRAMNKSACGWIVDLRHNTGGTMWPMLAGIGPLLGEGVLGAHVVPGGERSEWWYREGRAGVRTGKGERLRSAASTKPVVLSHESPVAVLLSGNTASAGEAAAIAFEGVGNTRSFGTSTAGLTTANVAIPLGQGASIILAIAYSADRTGNIYTGSVTPDESMAAGKALDAAQRWLEGNADCQARRKQ